MKRTLSLIILTVSLIAALVFYIVIFSGYSHIWFNFNAIFWLCVVTFLAGVGIFVSALLVEKREE